MLLSRVDAHAQIDVAFAHLDQVDARAELAPEGVRVTAGNHDVGGILHQRIGFESGAARTKAQRPGDTNSLHRARARTLLKCVVRAAASAHDVVFPVPAEGMFTGTCMAPQQKIENGGRVYSKCLIENSLWL